MGKHKRFSFWILTPEELNDKTIDIETLKKINADCVPELEPFYNTKRKRWEWRLKKDWEVKYNDKTYIVPAGFCSDGATIPRWLWPIFGTPIEIPRLYVAIIHDFLYTMGPKQNPHPGCSLRKHADRVYRDFNIQLGEPKLRTRIEYRFIRWFGGSHWVVADESTYFNPVTAHPVQEASHV